MEIRWESSHGFVELVGRLGVVGDFYFKAELLERNLLIMNLVVYACPPHFLSCLYNWVWKRKNLHVFVFYTLTSWAEVMIGTLYSKHDIELLLKVTLLHGERMQSSQIDIVTGNSAEC